MKKISIIFNKKYKDLILDSLNKKTGKEGYLVDSKTGLNVLTADGELIKSKELGAIKKGSEIYYKKDIASILRLFESTLKNGKSNF